MKVFGRDVLEYFGIWKEYHFYLYYMARVFVLFVRPLRLVRAYITQQPMPCGIVRLRDGTALHLSGHPHDAVTVFVILARRDYGTVLAGGVVVDIGANIGIFSVYAAKQGARKVVAFEPNSASYDLLTLNVEKNDLADTISTHRAAVTAETGQEVMIPRQASPYNATRRNKKNGECVQTTSLKDIVRDIGPIDLLKLDCEGAEYEILLQADEDVLLSIAAIRMEYHAGCFRGLTEYLARYGLVRSYHHAHGPISGTAWFERKS